ncbi:hypothetical protein [Roseisolibacter agri]|uniref:Uncharacterized protein n=1 Tax=Roseisolibacter agri TaxID=2014610 RepID=A0AA37Q2P8_9BACT|nr:hypothetical protein [Roseisolibacter agri]GLC25489.1 hypothetical protein rosag_20020 [Roseisolibacter agri]
MYDAPLGSALNPHVVRSRSVYLWATAGVFGLDVADERGAEALIDAVIEQVPSGDCFCFAIKRTEIYRYWHEDVDGRRIHYIAMLAARSGRVVRVEENGPAAANPWLPDLFGGIRDLFPSNSNGSGNGSAGNGKGGLDRLFEIIEKRILE